MGIKKFFRNIAISLAFGLKNTELDILKTKTEESDTQSIEQQQVTNTLADALLKGEVTQEVMLLRDRNYFVLEESKKYDVTLENFIVDHKTGEVTGDLKTKKKSLIVGKPSVFEDDYKMIISMETPMVVNNILDTMNAISGDELEKVESCLKFEYDWNEKFKLHRYIRKIVIRRKESDLVLDLYVPKLFTKSDSLESKFNAEINNVIDRKIKPNNLNFKTIYFISENAYGTEDLNEFKFETTGFKSINEFKNVYILTYEIKPEIFENKTTDKYIVPELREKYANKERRDNKLVASFENGL